MSSREVLIADEVVPDEDAVRTTHRLTAISALPQRDLSAFALLTLIRVS